LGGGTASRLLLADASGRACATPRTTAFIARRSRSSRAQRRHLDRGARGRRTSVEAEPQCRRCRPALPRQIADSARVFGSLGFGEIRVLRHDCFRDSSDLGARAHRRPCVGRRRPAVLALHLGASTLRQGRLISAGRGMADWSPRGGATRRAGFVLQPEPGNDDALEFTMPRLSHRRIRIATASRSPRRRSHLRRRRPSRPPARTPHLGADPGTAATVATRSRTARRSTSSTTCGPTPEPHLVAGRGRHPPVRLKSLAGADGVSPQRATGVRRERDNLRRRGATIEILVKDKPARSLVGAQPVRLNLSLPDNLVVGWSSVRRFAPSPRAG
jgi:hypothetical protein